MIKCQNCGMELPDEAKFCLSCGKPVVKPAYDTKIADQISEVEDQTFMLAGFGAFALMFAFMLLLPALIVPMWGFLVASIVLFIIAFILFMARHLIVKANKRAMEILNSKLIEKSTCTYCGELNEPDAKKCKSCGAPLGKVQ